LENGRAPSREKAYAILVSASIAEHPVKNCTKITKNHITVPPVLPPALRNICAAGIPVGLAIPSNRCRTTLYWAFLLGPFDDLYGTISRIRNTKIVTTTL
jgi:hypothetical protein